MIRGFFKKVIFMSAAVVLFATFQPQLGFSKNINVAPAALKPFSTAGVADPSICEDVQDLDYEGRGAGDAIFRNIKGIYIRANNYLHKPENKSASLFQSENLAILAACTLDKWPPLKNDPSYHVPPVYILDEKEAAFGFPHAQKDGNLIVSVTVEQIENKDPLYRASRGNLIQVTVGFYQHGVHDFKSSVNSQCAEAFNYTDNPKTLKELLTDAIHNCLSHAYNYNYKRIPE